MFLLLRIKHSPILSLVLCYFSIHYLLYFQYLAMKKTDSEKLCSTNDKVNRISVCHHHRRSNEKCFKKNSGCKIKSTRQIYQFLIYAE